MNRSGLLAMTKRITVLLIHKVGIGLKGQGVLIHLKKF